jgi:hypothetical protein
MTSTSRPVGGSSWSPIRWFDLLTNAGAALVLADLLRRFIAGRPASKEREWPRDPGRRHALRTSPAGRAVERDWALVGALHALA